MTAEQVRDLLLKRAWVILICAACGLIGALVGTAFMTPLYQSTVTMQAVVSPETPNTYALLVLDRFIGTEAQLADSPPILNAVAKQYPGVGAQILKSRVTATTDQNTQLFQITVVDSDPVRAASLANSIAGALITDEQNTLQQRNLRAEQDVQQEISTTQAQIQSVEVQLHEPNTSPTDAAKLNAELQTLQQAYKQYLETQAQLQTEDGLNAILLEVKVPATPNTQPVRPVGLVNAGVGLASGLLFGVLLVLVRAQLDQRIRSAEEAAALLGYPILADATAADVGSSGRYQTATAPDTPLPNGDLYLTLQQAIEFLSIDSPLRTVAVTGAQPSDATGVVAARWAVHLAQRGTMTLLVDADLFNPTLATYFSVSAPGGLSDAALALRQGESGDAAVRRHLIGGEHIGVPALALVPAGTKPPNPSQVLESQAMGLLFKALLSTPAEVVIFITPSAHSQITASSLETHVDGVVIVIELSQARRQQLVRLKSRLVQTGARVLGMVIVTREAVRDASVREQKAQSAYGPADQAVAGGALNLEAGLVTRRSDS